MKKIIFLIATIFIGCQDFEDVESVITIDYDQQYIVILCIDDYYLYISEYTGYMEITETFINQRVNNYTDIDLAVYKKYEPYDGILNLSVYDDDYVIQNGMRNIRVYWKR